MTDSKPMKDTRLPPVTQVTQGDTCEGCQWLVRGAEQTKGTFDWGCRFYYKNNGICKPYPIRLSFCDIDGKLSKERLERRNKRNKNGTEV